MGFTPPEEFNIADYFLGARIRQGDGERTALLHDDGELTYSEVEESAARTGHVLLGHGVRREERVLIAVPDGPAFVGALFAALKIGAVAVPINPGLPAERVAVLLDYVRPRVAVVDVAAIESFEAAAGAAGSSPEIIVSGGPAPGFPLLETDMAAVSDRLDAVATHRDDPAIWLFSGGTTGTPKGVVQTHRSFANTTELYAKEALGFRSSDVTLSVPKLYFGYALGSNLFFPFSVGAAAVLFAEHPTAEVLFQKISTHRPTILVNVPKMVNQMVSHAAAPNQDLSSLRFATSAGEALPEALYRRWREVFDVELLDGLGTAEMWHIFVTNTPGDVRPGTLGKPVPGFEVRVRDEDGVDIGPGRVGRLWVRGDSRAIAYWQNMDRTAEAFQGPWFVSGDLVAVDEEGYITHSGRADDALKVGGQWLAPQEVEGCLIKHDAVVECAVVGVEDEAGLTKPYAFVVVEEQYPGLEEELKQHVLAELEPYKHPRRVFFVDALPLTHLGKVNRAELKMLVEGEREGA